MKMNCKKEWLIFLLKELIFLCLVITAYRGLEYIMVDDTSSLTRGMFHEFYSQADGIDTVFLGTSHVFKGIDAKAVSERTGRQCFDLATSAQRLSASYYLLKEAEKYYDIESVYLEVSLAPLSIIDASGLSTYIISDYMRHSWNRYSFIKSNLEPGEYLYAFFPLGRGISILSMEEPLNFGDKTIALERKKEPAYKNYENMWTQRGYSPNAGCFTKSIPSYEGDIHVSYESFNEKQLGYLYAIIDECMENGIALTIFIMPFSNLYVAPQAEEYSEAINYLENIAVEKSVAFIDFNTVSRDDLQLDDSCFSDLDHLNIEGVEIFTECISGYMNNDFPYRQYSSAAERLEHEQGVYGVTYEAYSCEESLEREVKLHPIYNIDEEVVWHVSIVNADENDNVLHEYGDFTGNDVISITVSEKFSGFRLKLQAVNADNDVISVSYIDITRLL